MMKYETVIFCLIMSQDFQKIKVKVKVELLNNQLIINYNRSSEHH